MTWDDEGERRCEPTIEGVVVEHFVRQEPDPDCPKSPPTYSPQNPTPVSDLVDQLHDQLVHQVARPCGILDADQAIDEISTSRRIDDS
jgi:hypothetical protein